MSPISMQKVLFKPCILRFSASFGCLNSPIGSELHLLLPFRHRFRLLVDDLDELPHLDGILIHHGLLLFQLLKGFI